MSIETTAHAETSFADSSERNNWLESQLNPGQTLPVVQTLLLNTDLQPVSGSTLPYPEEGDPDGGSMYINDTDGKTIGAIVFGYDTLNHLPVVSDASVEIQGQGYGRRLYLEALKATPWGYKLTAHVRQSEDAKQVWEWLKTAGVAKDTIPSGPQNGPYKTIV